MAPSKPYTSEDMALLAERQQLCLFFDLQKSTPIISISSYDLYRPNSVLRCNPAALEKIQTALKKAYDDGIRDIGMFAPRALHTELIKTALSVSPDLDWKIYPRDEMAYLRDITEIQKRLSEDETLTANLDASLKVMEKEICDAYGFSESVLMELIPYLDVEDVQELPPHLRILFADGKAEENKKP